MAESSWWESKLHLPKAIGMTAQNGTPNKSNLPVIALLKCYPEMGVRYDVA